MNRYKLSKEYMAKSNPTQRTQKEILDVIQKSEMPMSITAIANKSGKGLYATKQTVEFLKRFGVVKTIVSSGNTTFVILNKTGEQNATN